MFEFFFSLFLNREMRWRRLEFSQYLWWIETRRMKFHKAKYDQFLPKVTVPPHTGGPQDKTGKPQMLETSSSSSSWRGSEQKKASKELRIKDNQFGNSLYAKHNQKLADCWLSKLNTTSFAYTNCFLREDTVGGKMLKWMSFSKLLNKVMFELKVESRQFHESSKYKLLKRTDFDSCLHLNQ